MDFFSLENFEKDPTTITNYIYSFAVHSFEPFKFY